LFFFFLQLVLFLSIPATTAAPTPANKRTESVERRADANFTGPMTVTTVDQINSASGPVTQTCTITLTPITLQDGSQAVQEVKNCELSKNAGGPVIGTPSQVTVTVSSTTLSSITVASTPAANAGLSVNGVSTVTAAATPTPDAAVAPAPTATSTGTTSSSVTAASALSAGSPTAAAAQQTTSGSFSIPGKKLSVLPIGLGVFAGISVIALIVVGLVTYERTKYRKAFRQRKLAEAGAQMGYGGMMQRA